MKFVRSILPGVAGVLAILYSSFAQAQSSPLALYDADHQALAINPYADGYGGTINIDFDFDGDHAWAGVIDQGGWHYLFGDLTEPGLSFSRTTCNPGGSCQTETLYGWGEPLGSLTPVQDFNTYVTSLSDGTEARDKFHFFADFWNVASGATTIYVRPMDSGNNSVPVMPEDAGHIYIRVSSSYNDFDWRLLADLNPPGPVPVAATVHVSPKTLNLKSKGQWITVRVELPTDYTAQAVDLSSIRLRFRVNIKDNNGLLQKSELQTSGPLTVSHDDGLIVKFNRKEVQTLIRPGVALLTVSGKFTDGTVFVGTDTIRVIE